MNVCFAAIDYHAETAGGGIASYVGTVARGLVERGHRVTVLASGDRHEVTDEDGLQVIRAPLGNAHWYLHRLHAPSPFVLPVRELEWSWSLRRMLRRVMREERVDIVEGQETGVLFMPDDRPADDWPAGSCPEGNCLPPALVVRLHGDAYIYRRHSGEPIPLGMRLDRRLQRRAWQRAAAITAPTRFQAREAADSLAWPHGRIEVIPNPIDPWFLQQAGEESRPESDEHAPCVLYVGRIEHTKGTLPLLASVPRVAAQVPGVRYLIAGGRHVSIGDRQLAAALARESAGRHVRLLGHVPWTDLPALYRRAQVFVMPSYYETFGISAVEAMAFGAPVVATRTGGLPEVVEDGVTGILVPPGDSAALADAVVRLLRDPQLRRRMGEAGRRRVQQRFTPEHVVEPTLALYERLSQQVSHERA